MHAAVVHDPNSLIFQTTHVPHKAFFAKDEVHHILTISELGVSASLRCGLGLNFPRTSSIVLFILIFVSEKTFSYEDRGLCPSFSNQGNWRLAAFQQVRQGQQRFSVLNGFGLGRRLSFDVK